MQDTTGANVPRPVSSYPFRILAIPSYPAPAFGSVALAPDYDGRFHAGQEPLLLIQNRTLRCVVEVLLRLEQEDRAVAEVEVEEVLRL